MSLTAEEKEDLKKAKSEHKTFIKNFPQLYEKNRAEIVETIVNSKVPNWGGIKVVYK